MRPLVLLVLGIMVPTLFAQREPSPAELAARVTALEREIADLKNEIARLKSLELRLRALEQIVATGAEPGAGDPRAGLVPGGPARPETLTTVPLDGMPYEDDRTFLVTALREEGTEAPGGRTKRRIDVDLIEIPAAGVAQALRVQVLGYRHLGFPPGLPSGTRRYRLVLENLGTSEAISWAEALRSEVAQAEGRDVVVYKQIRFARVSTAQTHFNGYEGHSGTVQPWRGELHWYENDVFFLEDGALHLVGGAAARFHLRFVRDESLSEPR